MAVAGIGVWNTLGTTIRGKISESDGKMGGLQTTPQDPPATPNADPNGG